MSSAAYFNLLATLMKDNPPAKADAPIVERMARLGIIPGQPFDFGQLDPQAQQALQNENPGPDKESNWLPAPTGKFILMLRLYWPKETPPSIIDGSWKIPGVQKVK
jgi:hypothetical protein